MKNIRDILATCQISSNSVHLKGPLYTRNKPKFSFVVKPNFIGFGAFEMDEYLDTLTKESDHRNKYMRYGRNLKK